MKDFDTCDPWPRKLIRGKSKIDDSFALMPPTVAGFNLQTKEWGKLCLRVKIISLG
jgi:hypothetical protein